MRIRDSRDQKGLSDGASVTRLTLACGQICGRQHQEDTACRCATRGDGCPSFKRVTKARESYLWKLRPSLRSGVIVIPPSFILACSRFPSLRAWQGARSLKLPTVSIAT